MWIEITTAIGCTNNCAFCPQQLFTKKYYLKFGKESPRLLVYADFVRILKKIPKKTIIVFSGFCEPFQNPKCTDMILAAQKRGYGVHVFTTLMGLNLINLNRILRQASVYNTFLKFDVHIPSEDHIENIQITDEYYRVLMALFVLPEQNLEFHYHGLRPVKKIKKIVVDAGYDVQYIRPMWRAGNVMWKGAPPVARKYGRIMCDSIPGRGYVILPNGVVLLCCMDYGMENVLGNLLNDSYGYLDKSDVWKRILLGVDDDRIDILCRQCHFARDMSAKAVLLNTPFSVKKLPALMKIGLYRFSPGTYNAMRDGIHKFLGKRKIKTALTDDWIGK